MNLANYAQAELTRDQSAFFALIWNNEVSNKVTHRVLSMRPAAEDKQGRPAIEKRLGVWPCSLLRNEFCGPPHCEEKRCRRLWPVARLSKRTQTARSSLPESLRIHKDFAAKLNRLSRPALKTILWSNSSQVGLFGTRAKTNEAFWWLVLAKASVADLETWSDYKKGLEKGVRWQTMSGTKVSGVFIFFLPNTGIL